MADLKRENPESPHGVNILDDLHKRKLEKYVFQPEFFKSDKKPFIARITDALTTASPSNKKPPENNKP